MRFSSGSRNVETPVEDGGKAHFAAVRHAGHACLGRDANGHRKRTRTAVERIATALRAAGIEVWFGQSELRGGDGWDHKIREQVHGCRLFVPVISSNTERRDEGFFRREWALAVDRTRDMAHKRTFLVPVVVDAPPNEVPRCPTSFTNCNGHAYRVGRRFLRLLNG